MRGQASPVGAERIAPNGYQYVKTADRSWVLKHWLVFEEVEGRRVDTTKEQIRFKDGNCNNLDPSNIISVPKGTSGIRGRIARLEARKAELEGLLDYYYKELAKRELKTASAR
jgi:hypothetical protein